MLRAASTRNSSELSKCWTAGHACSLGAAGWVGVDGCLLFSQPGHCTLVFIAAVGAMIASEVNGERVVKYQDKCFYGFKSRMHHGFLFFYFVCFFYGENAINKL